MEISVAEATRLAGVFSGLRHDRKPFWTLWRELADFYIPKRYVWLQTDRESRVRKAKNPFILDSTGTTAGRTLASGLMNGITSPSRPWFKLRVPGYDDEGGPVTMWADEVARRMMIVMSESNFYNSMATIYLDLVFFGTAATLIYEDQESVIRCYNCALGEYYLSSDENGRVNTFGREFLQSAGQLVSRFGLDNVSETVRSLANNKDGGGKFKQLEVCHLLEPNFPGSGVAEKFKFIETYWEKGGPKGKALERRGFNEIPGIFPRWEVTGNDNYGTSPSMDALPDVIQLQLETKLKAKGLDKAVSPPVVADIQLQHRPTALLPNGITYVTGANSVGVKPVYSGYAPPIQEMTEDIRDIRIRIQEVFYNPLFNMISQLDTVRSATEIDARREEKLVLLGSVLERFEAEALNPAIDRIFAVMERKGLIPDPPQEIAGQKLDVQYVSILATAQRAVAAAPTERWIALLGQIAAVAPETLAIPNWDELIRNYGIAIGVEARNMHTREEVEQIKQQQAEQQAAQQAAVVGPELVDGAKTLSETDVGGGSSALQMLLAQG